jgi:hypothetical protein
VGGYGRLVSRAAASSLRSPIGFASALTAVVLLAGCGSGEPNTTETTPPALSWSVTNKETKERQDVQGSGSVSAGPQDSFLVVFKANDSGGVKTMSLGGSATWSCSSGEVGQTGIEDYAGQKQTLHPDSKGEVDQYAFMLTNVSTGWVCQGGFDFGGGFAALQGSAGNYSGREATATLKIVRKG